MINNDATMKEKRDVLRNDQRTTLSQFAQSDADIDRGRFTTHERSTVVGASSVPQYPAGPAWCDADQGLEPPLGVCIDAMEPCGQPHELKAIADLGPSSLASPDQEPPSRSSQVVPPLADERLGFSQRAYRRF